MNKLSLLLGGLFAFNASANVIITEYVEGGGHNKAIEITNLGTSEVALGEQGYSLSLYTNGKDTASGTAQLTGILPPNASLVIYNKGFVEASSFPAPIGIADSSAVNHNGDDAYVLRKGDEVVDSIGQVGVDPGSYWGSSDDNTKDHTLRRIPSVTSGDVDPSDAFDPTSGQWSFFAKDTFDGLGCSGEAACTGNEPKPTSEGDAPVGDTCLFTRCDETPKIKQSTDYIESEYYANAHAAADADTATFKNAVHTDIKKDHNQLTYNQVWTALIETDQDPANADNVILLYTGKSIPKSENASVMGNAPDSWNREHVWSKSHGFPGSSQLGYTDLHHLRPADASINSARSNYDFDNGGDPVYDGDTVTANNLLAGTSWEPRDEVKGDVARMMFYMAVRYEQNSDQDMPDLVLVDRVGTDGAEFGKLCSLYEWHTNDAVDTAELARNNAIYEFQGNRNPFIDHPEWVEKLYKDQCEQDQVVMPTVSATNTSVEEDGTVTITAEVNVEQLTFAWSQQSGVSVTLTDTDTATVTLTAPSVDKEEVVVLAITVTDAHGNQASTTVEVTITNKTEPVPMPIPPVASSSSGGSLGFISVLLLGLLTARRQLKAL